MNRVEDGFSESIWDKRPRRPVADVDDRVGLPNVDGLEIEARSSVVPHATKVRVQRLLCRYVMPIDAVRADGVDDAVQVVSGGL